MDAIRKQRKSLRAAFTRTHRTFEKEWQRNSSREEKVVAFQLLEVRMTELNEVQSEYNKLLFDSDATEETIAKELEADDGYIMLYLRAKMAVQEFTQSGTKRAPSVTSDIMLANTRKTIKLPVIELTEFSGNIKEWLPFWSVFKKIHEDPALRNEDKFQYLVQATAPDSRAHDLINSFPPTAENYEKVIRSLKNRFGRDDVVVEFYVRELLTLVLQNAVKGNHRTNLATIFDKLEAYICALDTLGVTTDKCAAMLYPLVESSLPGEVLREWQRSGQRENIDVNGQREIKDRLAKLLEFLQSEVENQERIDMFLRGFKFQNDGHKRKKQKGKNETARDIASALLTTREAKIVECIFCKGAYESQECESAQKLSFSERKGCVQNSNACFLCVKRGHVARFCRSKIKCGWCNSRHDLVLCSATSAKNDTLSNKSDTKNEVFENSLATLSHVSENCMNTLKVKVVSEHQEKIVTAIIDTASQRSYIRLNVAKELDYKSCGNIEVPHSLFGGVKSKIKKYDKFLIRLKNLDGSYACNFSVLGQDTICDTFPCFEKKSWLEKLDAKNIILSDFNDKQETIDILIGADIAGKLLTGKRYDLENGLVAIETLLGWTVMGKVPREYEEEILPVNMLTTSTVIAREADLTDLWNLEVLVLLKN